MLFLTKLLSIFVYPLGLTVSLLAANMGGALLSLRQLKVLATARRKWRLAWALLSR